MMETRRDRIGRYVVHAELGRGAMGVVYRARDPQLDRYVAIKTVRRDLGLTPEADAELRKRVYQEATAAGRLTHPGIVAIYDVIELDEIPFIVMEFVDGRTLAQRIATGGPLPPAEAVGLVTEVCRALDYAHGHGVIHRDIKPSNILVTASGSAKVTDFGIARIAGHRVTRTGAILGTPAYMAPEQLRGAVLDGRSDVFSLAVTLYETLTGVAPFQGDDLAALLYQIAHEAPVPLSARNPAVPRSLEPVTERAMAKDPGARYATAGAFADALTRAMAAEPPRGTRSASRSRRRRARTRLVTVACLALVAFGGWAAWSRRAPDRPVVAAPPEAPMTEAAPEPTPVAPVTVSPPVESDRSAWSITVADAPTVGAAAAATPVEEPAPPAPPDPPVKPPPPRVAERTPPRPVLSLGTIRVVTDPSVEVLLDGQYRGRAKSGSLVVPKVATGERMVTLRLASREQTLFAMVNGGQTATVTYHFPPELKKPREALDRVRDGVEKAHREAAGALRDIFDQTDGDRGRRGRNGSPEAERR